MMLALIVTAVCLILSLAVIYAAVWVASLTPSAVRSRRRLAAVRPYALIRTADALAVIHATRTRHAHA